MRAYLLIGMLSLSSCATNRKIDVAAPLNIPKPTTTKAADKLAQELSQAKTNLDSATIRIERIKLLLETLNEQ